jgi:uncharacterized protein YdaU (DUF1376 family)
MSNAPFMPLWVADFVGDTLDLGAKEIGAYMLILMTMWGRDGYLPNDTKKLQRVARCGRDWPRVWSAIEHYFTVEGDQITQLRLLKERKNVASKREVNAQSGALGGRAKSLKYKEATIASATETPKQPEPYPEPDIKEKDTNVSFALFAPECDPPDRFNDFWDQYPHRGGAKKGKASAQKAWQKAIKARASPDQIIAGAMRYAGDRQVISGYAKDPATWLNAKGWQDEIEQHSGNSGSRPSGTSGGMVAAFAAVASRRTPGSGRN